MCPCYVKIEFRSSHLGFGKYGGPNGRRLQRPQKRIEANDDTGSISRPWIALHVIYIKHFYNLMVPCSKKLIIYHFLWHTSRSSHKDFIQQPICVWLSFHLTVTSYPLLCVFYKFTEMKKNTALDNPL